MCGCPSLSLSLRREERGGPCPVLTSLPVVDFFLVLKPSDFPKDSVDPIDERAAVILLTEDVRETRRLESHGAVLLHGLEGLFSQAKLQNIEVPVIHSNPIQLLITHICKPAPEPRKKERQEDREEEEDARGKHEEAHSAFRQLSRNAKETSNSRHAMTLPAHTHLLPSAPHLSPSLCLPRSLSIQLFVYRVLSLYLAISMTAERKTGEGGPPLASLACEFFATEHRRARVST